MATADPAAIIDIGSNSVRLVVYAGPPRIPSPIFNEKVLAGLGSSADRSGNLPERPRARALAAIHRFKLLIDHMRVKQVRVVATAAIRDAANGADFVRDVKRLGLECEVLSAEEEARLAGEGVLSGMPRAIGTVGDLGGGSLELVDIGDGETHGGISMPLGVLRLDASSDGERKARKILRAALKETDIGERAKGRRFYMVGGSWRTLARIDMFACDFPLPITHQYRMKPGRVRDLRKMLKSPDQRLASAAAPQRMATSPVAAMLLDLIVDELEPSDLVVSAYGIREGLLYSALKPAIRNEDPLLEEARSAGGGEHRFGQHGDLLDQWIAPLFDDGREMSRLRHAACLLADVAWQATANFRADRGIEMALHGNWVAVDAPGRVIMAQALSSSFGREVLPDERLGHLVSADQLRRAHCWGAAMRLGQRLSGGVGAVLKRTSLSKANGAIRLHVRRGEEALVGDAVERRLTKLAESMGRGAAVVSG
ncbi:exopolyphosphatase [Sphingomonas limnosediminicola]|uniref:Exopolyphosphatase n=1 Tax=Sphingomonas limnosediminicola TaxID=940133 RepID=A0ABP7L0X7_9SPHN